MGLVTESDFDRAWRYQEMDRRAREKRNGDRLVAGFGLVAALELIGFALAALFLSSRADAATITVNPGQSIQTEYNKAVAGDVVLVKPGTYTGGIALTKSSVRVQGEGLVTLRPSTVGSGTAVSVQCSSCGVDNIDFKDFRYGVSPSGITGRNAFTLTNSWLDNCNYPIWISGDDWRVEGNVFTKAKWRASSSGGGDGDSDYGRIFGNRHVFRRNMMGDTNILSEDGTTDGKPGPDYSHTDCLQFYNQNGEILRDVLIEENVFTDFVQGLFIGNETGNGTSVQRVTVRHNVFWGTRFRASGNLLGSPSWGVYFGKNGPERQIVIEHNIFRQISNAIGMLTGTDAICRRNVVANSGGVYILEGTSPSLITRAPGGNLLWSNQHSGELNTTGDTTNVDPQFRYPNAASLMELAGPDGVMWTNDDAWRMQNTAAAAFGPQIGNVTPPVNTAPSVTIAPVAPVTLNAGETSRAITTTATGVDAEGAVTYQWTGGPAAAVWTASQGVGTVRRTVVVFDAGGLSATAFVDVVVNAAPVVPPVGEDMATQKELDDAIANLNARINGVQATATAAQSTAGVALGAANQAQGDVDALGPRVTFTEDEIKAIRAAMRAAGMALQN
jgi:hypothetical protein